MQIEHRDVWKEISKKEFNKYAYNCPKDATMEQAFKYLLNFNPKYNVKREIVIPEHICGILNVGDYIDSNEPKTYKYFKSIGKETVFIVSSAEYEYYKDKPIFKDMIK